MKCVHCGAMIPDDQLVCPHCGTEVQIVPDYNPLDDVLAREVRGSVEGSTRQIQTDDIRRYRQGNLTKNINSTRVISEKEMAQLRSDRQRNSQQSQRRTSETTELRRQKQARQQKRLEAAKRKRRNILITMFAILALICIGIFVVYQNSYTGMLKKGYKAIASREYEDADRYFDRAVIKDKSRPEAYDGHAKIFMDQGDLESAEAVYLSAIETQPTNTKLYQAAIKFYMDTEQPSKVASLLADCEDEGVLASVSEYVCLTPELKPEEGTYEEVQEITISSETKGTIYYTTDGSDPTAETGTKYTEPILLQTEGTTEIRAIVVNKKGIPSDIVSGTYKIEFPIADSPAITPSTGRYEGEQQITISVPEGYTAYYTMDGSTPTSSSTKYTGPVEMPKDATTIFSAILVNDQNGKETGVTTRSYITTVE